MIRTTVTVGAAIRRDFRAHCDLLGILWTEHRGLLSSTFVVEGCENALLHAVAAATGSFDDAWTAVADDVRVSLSRTAVA